MIVFPFLFTYIRTRSRQCGTLHYYTIDSQQHRCSLLKTDFMNINTKQKTSLLDVPSKTKCRPPPLRLPLVLAQDERSTYLSAFQLDWTVLHPYVRDFATL